METFIASLSRKQKIVLNYFLENPTTEIHLRGLAKKTGVSHTWIGKTLEEFEQKKIIRIEKDHDFSIRADRENPLFIDIKRSSNFLKLHDLAEHLEKKYRPDAIIAFGSYARGEDIEKSDIDIAMITPEKIENLDLQEFEKELGKHISIQIIKKTSGDFKSSLANGIVLRGYLE